MDELTDEQEAMVVDFASRHSVDKHVALRFILGRKWDLARASVLLENYQALLAEHSLKNLSVKDVFAELETGKLVDLGTRANDGSEILLISAMRHHPEQFDADSTFRLAFFVAEVITQSVPTQRDGITVIVNMDKLDWQQSDYSFYRDVVQLFQNNFPCRVKNILVFRPPWWIDLLLRLVSPFLKPKMRERIHILANTEQFDAFAAKAALPEDLGGTFHFDCDAFVKRQLAKESTAKISRVFDDFRTVDLSPDTGERRVSEEVAQELVQERLKAVAELDAAIEKRRASLSVQQQNTPIDFARIARCKAARMSLSLSDALPFGLATPVAGADQKGLLLSDDEQDRVESMAPEPTLSGRQRKRSTGRRPRPSALNFEAE